MDTLNDITILADRIDAVLPQTQCTQCGYAGCRPYAEALAQGKAAINQCPPGGDAGIKALAQLLDQSYMPLNPAHGVSGPKMLAVIDESSCIGCTLCIKACPVDAILGAHKQMHTIIESDCTGCELCVAPCPVDCISMQPLIYQKWDYTVPVSNARQVADAARERHKRHLQRMQQHEAKRIDTSLSVQSIPANSIEAKKAAIAAAMARARAQRQSLNTDSPSQKL